MAQSTAELLATTGVLLDASDSLYADLKRIAKQTEPIASATIVSAKDSASAAALSCCTASADSEKALSRSVDACRAASDQLRELSSARSKMADLRTEMLAQVAEKLARERLKATDAFAARRSAMEAENQEALRAIMAKHGLPMPAVAVTSPA